MAKPLSGPAGGKEGISGWSPPPGKHSGEPRIAGWLPLLGLPWVHERQRSAHPGGVDVSEPEAVPAAVRAQLLATEHWSLLATRSQTWNEVLSRIMAQFTFASATLVVLALAFQQGGWDGPFRPLVLGLGAAVLLTGTLTGMRVHYASSEDAALVTGMNRLRRAYVDLDPGVAPYLVTGTSDDFAGLSRTYTMGPERRAAWQVLASASMFITVVNALVAGGWIGILTAPLGTVASVALGVLAGSLYVAAFVYAGYRAFLVTFGHPGSVRFPVSPDD